MPKFQVVLSLHYVTFYLFTMKYIKLQTLKFNMSTFHVFTIKYLNVRTTYFEVEQVFQSLPPIY